MVSRIVENKGVKEFILAAEELKKKYSNWKFFIIGSKAYKNNTNIAGLNPIPIIGIISPNKAKLGKV